MGRNERAIDPSADEIQLFAHDLRELRRTAGNPTYRELSHRCGYAAPTLSEAAAGRKLPTLRVALAYVRECGGDEESWQQRWEQLSRSVAHQPTFKCPYPGLAQFRTEDSHFYFGREDIAEELASLVLENPVVGLVGASGSGKSSLLRAGLIPRITERPEDAILVRIVTPGNDLAEVFRELRESNQEAVLVIDQYEELFTLENGPSDPSEIIPYILEAQHPASRLKIIVSLRTDYLDQCIEDHRIAAALSRSTIMLSAMSRDQIRRAVVAPAMALGYTVEKELTERIVTEVYRHGGSLPLMSHTLREVWNRSKGKLLTLAQYEAVGEVGGAIEQTAETFYQGLSEDERRQVKGILLRLVVAEPGRPCTKRPVLAHELDAPIPVLEQLIKTRLLVRDGQYLELSHEAVATAWPRLAKWVDEAAERMKTVRKVADAARTWQELSRDQGALYRGMLLEGVVASLGPSLDDLNPVEREFLAAGTKLHRRILTARKILLLATYILPLATMLFWLVWFVNRPHP